MSRPKITIRTKIFKCKKGHISNFVKHFPEIPAKDYCPQCYSDLINSSVSEVKSEEIDVEVGNNASVDDLTN